MKGLCLFLFIYLFIYFNFLLLTQMKPKNGTKQTPGPQPQVAWMKGLWKNDSRPILMQFN